MKGISLEARGRVFINVLCNEVELCVNFFDERFVTFCIFWLSTQSIRLSALYKTSHANQAHNLNTHDICCIYIYIYIVCGVCVCVCVVCVVCVTVYYSMVILYTVYICGVYSNVYIEGWGTRREDNFTGEPKTKMFTIVWSGFVYWFQLLIIQICTLMDDSNFASRNRSLRASIWCIYLHFTKMSNTPFWFSPLDIYFTHILYIYIYNIYMSIHHTHTHTL